jgi:hypothetical protein
MNAIRLMDRRVNPRCAYPYKLIVSDHYFLPLAVFGLLLIVATAAQGDTPLPAITVTGKATPTPTPVGDAINRDWIQRSPEMHWPTAMFNRSAEVFAHNQIEINASCEAVWDHLVHAELWPKWCPYSGKVKIWGGSQVLQKNAKFSWLSSDVPQLVAILGQVPLTKSTAWLLNAILRTVSVGAVTGELGPFMVHWLIPTTTGSLNPWGLESA